MPLYQGLVCLFGNDYDVPVLDRLSVDADECIIIIVVVDGIVAAPTRTLPL